MGRKIPAKKHRGVKDPEKQRAKRLAELESCTNAAPKNADEQAIPKSLEQMIKLKEAAKINSGILKKKRKKKKNTLICVGQQHPKLGLHPRTKPEKVVPIFQQRPGESDEKFLHRVSRDTHAFCQESAFENKYGVQVERDPKTGRIQGLTKLKRENNDIEVLRNKHKNIKKKKRTAEDSTILTKNEKQKLKLRMKKEKKLENDDEFENLQDKIVFGEVVHSPPKLKYKLNKINEERKPKNLLLNSLLEDSKKISSGFKVIDRSGKRKNLPVAERRRLEKQQNEAVAAYRQLKSQRLINRNC